MEANANAVGVGEAANPYAEVARAINARGAAAKSRIVRDRRQLQPFRLESAARD
jgi:hypothetical protein